MKKWKTLQSTSLVKTPFFELQRESCQTNSGKFVSDYYRFDMSNWVQIVAITKDSQFLLIHQYRHGFRDWSWEVPGGAVDKEEESLAAAKRELLEETGYEAPTWYLLQDSCPNPALQSNRLFTYLALDVEKIAPQNLDPFEEIDVCIKTRDDLEKMIEGGEIQHSLMLMSICLALRHLDQKR